MYIRVPTKEKGENGAQGIFEKIMLENFQKLSKNMTDLRNSGKSKQNTYKENHTQAHHSQNTENQN